MLSCIQKIIDFRGRTPKKLGMDWSESGYLALSALNVKDGYIDFSQDVHYGDQALYDKWMSGNELHKGQVLFTTEAPMGNVAQVPYNKQYILSQRTIAFDVKEDIITENFLATLLKSPVVFNTLTSLSSGGTAKGVSQKSLAGVDVRIPVDLREQTLLATYFHNIDHLITLHQRKVESLIKFKKGMLQKMFPKEGCDIPEIRFKGCYDEYGNWVAFTDPWEQRKLGELALTYSGGTPSAGNSAYYGGEIPFIRSAEIDCDSTELSLTVAGLNNSSAKLVDKGMVLYAMYGATSGEVAISKIKGAINQAILAMDASDMAANRFIAYWLRRQKKSITETFLQGGQGNLSGAIIKELGIPQPSLDEQRQIGSFFSNLDDLITLHQRKYDKLVIFKKSMLEKMFPKDGESVPEIRFAGFTDPWEQRKLSEVATFGGGHTPPMADPDNYEDGYVLWVTSQDVKSNYLDRTTTQITEKGAKELTLYPAGSLVMVTRSGILRHTLPVAELRKPSTVNQDIRVILPQGECCGEWLLQFFISHNKELLLEFGKTGTTVESVDFGKIKDMLLYMPSTVEQQQIGDFFAKLDSLITLHQRKLELLQNIKKSLLDKMFV